MNLQQTYPKITAVTPLNGFCLKLQFSSGETGTLDVSPYLDFGVFTRLRDPAAFEQAQIAFDTVEWPCGVDLDPAFVYAKCRMHSAA
jgi:Protein of unknown function (DUF2442)